MKNSKESKNTSPQEQPMTTEELLNEKIKIFQIRESLNNEIEFRYQTLLVLEGIRKELNSIALQIYEGNKLKLDQSSTDDEDEEEEDEDEDEDEEEEDDIDEEDEEEEDEPRKVGRPKYKV